RRTRRPRHTGGMVPQSSRAPDSRRRKRRAAQRPRCKPVLPTTQDVAAKRSLSYSRPGHPEGGRAWSFLSNGYCSLLNTRNVAAPDGAVIGLDAPPKFRVPVANSPLCETASFTVPVPLALMATLFEFEVPALPVVRASAALKRPVLPGSFRMNEEDE